MLSRRALTSFLCVFAASLAFFGCAAKTKPVVWVDQNVSFANFRSFELQPVFNATGKMLEDGVLTSLTTLLWKRLENINLPLTDSSETTGGVLVVQSELMLYEVYKPIDTYKPGGYGGWGETQSTLRTRLLDKSNNQVVAEIVVTKVASAGKSDYVRLGPSSINTTVHEKILNAVVVEVVDEIARLMAPMKQ